MEFKEEIYLNENLRTVLKYEEDHVDNDQRVNETLLTRILCDTSIFQTAKHRIGIILSGSHSS